MIGGIRENIRRFLNEFMRWYWVLMKIRRIKKKRGDWNDGA